VLDPGHGGRDNGTSVHEKTFALEVAQRARQQLEAAGFRVALTRDEDKFVDLKDRPAFAKANRADLFVSIHFNALRNDTRTSGVELYTFVPAKQHASGWWSVLRRDDPDFETGEEPVNRYDHWSVVLAQQIQRHFVVDLKAFDRGKKIAHYGMLRGLDCPGVLVECGFLTSEVEARKIATPEYREKIAQAIVAGVSDYAAVVKTAAARP
jgi:N-acetylmuramoyl-L-alanine amidase